MVCVCGGGGAGEGEGGVGRGWGLGCDGNYGELGMGGEGEGGSRITLLARACASAAVSLPESKGRFATQDLHQALVVSVMSSLADDAETCRATSRQG